MRPLLDISALSARLHSRGTPILRDVSVAVKPGEVHGLVGESGAGKSTIAKAVLGILPATITITGGQLRFDRYDLLGLRPKMMRDLLGREIALIPQDPTTALNPARRIEAQMTDGLRLKRGLSPAEARAEALRLLAEVHIRDPERVLTQYPHELSGGMRQRVLIASAFGLEPRLIIADEPTSALDVTVQKQILRLIRRMQERHMTAVLFVTHDLGVVAQICDRVSVLYQGKLIEEAATGDLFSRPSHAYTRALIAANPRYDQPNNSLAPVPAAVVAQLAREIAAHDANARPTAHDANARPTARYEAAR